MPINIADLVSQRKTVYIEEHDLTLTYRPNQLTPAMEIAILQSATTEGADDDDENDELLRSAQRNIKRQVASFVELVESWDLQGALARDAGGQFLLVPNSEASRAAEYVAERGGELLVEPGAIVPLKDDYLVLLGSFFLTEVVRHINEDMRPPKGRRKR